MEYCHFLRATWVAAGLYAYLTFPAMVQRQTDYWNNVFNNDPPAEVVCLKERIVPLDDASPVGSEAIPEYPVATLATKPQGNRVSAPLDYYPLTMPLIMNQTQE